LLTLQEIRKSQLETMTVFRDFCERNQLRYYLAYGTLLGAVRHRGFIPWDDDADIYMPREDYDFLLRHFNEESPAARRVISKESCPEFYLRFAKIIDGNTVLTEMGQTLEIGVWIDIFPLDYVTDDRRLYTRVNRRIGFISIFLPYASLKPRKGRAAYKNLIVRILNLVLPTEERLLQRRKARIDSIAVEKSNTYGLFHQSFGFYGIPIAERGMFDPPVKLMFEGEEFDAPKEYGKILTYFYGSEYMTPPPEKKRSGHRYVCDWKEK